LPAQRHRDHQSRDDLPLIARSSRRLPPTPGTTWPRKVQNGRICMPWEPSTMLRSTAPIRRS